ncbi:MAG: hypothetical protein PHO32_01235 [Candidatus Cloacimonetes bacterium]|nr:hypothetical protein [Candidatus Cloacimonadota bacterium]
MLLAVSALFAVNCLYAMEQDSRYLQDGTIQYSTSIGKYKWMSFPVLFQKEQDNILGNLLMPIVNQNTLDWVMFRSYAERPRKMEFVTSNLIFGDTPVHSLQGFKIKLNQACKETQNICITGKEQNLNTTIELFAKDNLGNYTENWIGYFNPQSARILEAIEPICDKVLSVKSQYWSIGRKPEGGWVGDVDNCIINYGDMVVIRVKENCDFTWNHGKPVNAVLAKAPQHFQFEEYENYIPLYLELSELSDNDMPTEVGVFINDLCVGASRVNGKTLSICVYPDRKDWLRRENFLLVFHYQSGTKKVCYFQDSNLLEVSFHGTNYFYMPVNKSCLMVDANYEDKITQVWAAHRNRETEVSYELASDGNIVIEVLDKFGKQVTTLVDCAKVSGSHRVIWNGTDKYGRNVASGIYHYRMITPDKSITKKMLLLK